MHDYGLRSAFPQFSLTGWPTLLGLLLIAPQLTRATSINFDQFADSTVLTTQMMGLTFGNTEVLTAGISLNEIDFPPHSGSNVAIDNGGPITIAFVTPITSLSGYFTYTVPLTVTGLNSTNAISAQAFSSFSNNTGTGGDTGSEPNEFLQIDSTTGITSVTILGSALGGSFAVDDISFAAAATTTVAEPSTTLLSLTALISLLGVKRLAQ